MYTIQIAMTKKQLAILSPLFAAAAKDHRRYGEHRRGAVLIQPFQETGKGNAVYLRPTKALPMYRAMKEVRA